MRISANWRPREANAQTSRTYVSCVGHLAGQIYQNTME